MLFSTLAKSSNIQSSYWIQRLLPYSLIMFVFSKGKGVGGGGGGWRYWNSKLEILAATLRISSIF